MIVVDATVLVKVLTRELGSDAARDRIVRDDERIAPDWIRVEIANVLVRKVERAQFPPDAVPDALDAVPLLLTELADSVDLIDEAVRLAIGLGHPVYDCLYLALAERRGASLITHDADFVRAARRGGFGERIELLG